MLTRLIPDPFKRGRVRVWLLPSLLVLAAARPAGAEPCRLCSADPGEPEARAAAPVRVEVEASLDFDRVLLTAGSGGTARIGADGTRTSSGAVAPLTGRAMVGRVVVQGEPNRSIRIDLPKRIELLGWHGGRLTLSAVTTDLSSWPRLDGSGRLTFQFGGEVRVEGDAEGDYRGDVPITVEYP
ncbi:MAG: hypothetical protein AVDCRST_MAG31-1460 [uncultured Sphingomonas sp.]|uniref:DUF4402 domain-containing protein n=1 Tax=uncultured Sphingomonas sp. TaxID=158754 RepID=A0A6J4TB20_9SPHN|nr:DUF4402 domain-containing protein [uncultured Sphingomonas sp.]CAA9519060.1 MAG: hypothetical protein AVDCRST_MAG31-1460 [uncultured Sphingomonas sp.]